MLAKLLEYPWVKLGIIYGIALFLFLLLHLVETYYPNRNTLSQAIEQASDTAQLASLRNKITSEISSTNFALQALGEATLANLPEELSTNYQNYQKVCVYISLAEQLILHGIKDRMRDTLRVSYGAQQIHKTPMEIKTNLRLINTNAGGKYTFLNKEQKKELTFYVKVVESYVLGKLEGLPTFLSRMRREKQEKEYQAIIAFLERRKLKI